MQLVIALWKIKSKAVLVRPGYLDPNQIPLFVHRSKRTNLLWGLRVRRGQWGLESVRARAHVFESLEEAKRVVGSAAMIKEATTKRGWRAAIHGASLLSTGFVGEVGAEVWPSPTDPVLALAAIS